MTTRPDEWHWPELPGLLEEWRKQWREGDGTGCKDEFLARRAAEWQLMKVWVWLSPRLANSCLVQSLMAAMRPAPPATAATALAALDVVDRPFGCVTASGYQQIRLALLRLEALRAQQTLQRLQQLEQEAGQ